MYTDRHTHTHTHTERRTDGHEYSIVAVDKPQLWFFVKKKIVQQIFENK